MLKTLFITLLTLTTLIQQSVLANPKNIKISSLQNRPAIMVSINGSEPLLFILDTGFGGKLMIDNDVALSFLTQTS